MRGQSHLFPSRLDWQQHSVANLLIYDKAVVIGTELRVTPPPPPGRTSWRDWDFSVSEHEHFSCIRVGDVTGRRTENIRF